MILGGSFPSTHIVQSSLTSHNMYNKNLDKMTQEQLRMQMLAGIITEGQYKAKLNEGKQVGTLYHFTYIPALREILRTNVLGDAEGLEYGEPELYRKNIASDNKYGRIALTRNKNFSPFLG
jgi:hypothetical protein